MKATITSLEDVLCYGATTVRWVRQGHLSGVNYWSIFLISSTLTPSIFLMLSFGYCCAITMALGAEQEEHRLESAFRRDPSRTGPCI